MSRLPGAFSVLLVVAIGALWLLLAGPGRVLGIDSGNAGMALLLTVTWLSLYLLARMPGSKVENVASPGEWSAWIGTGVTATILGYSLLHAGVFQGPPVWQNPDAGRVGRNIALLVIGWIVVMQVLRSRWRERVQEDERDRQIASSAVEWARSSLVVYIVGIAVLLAFSPVERLAWAPPPMLAHLLIVGLIGSCLAEYLVTALAYRRDRR